MTDQRDKRVEELFLLAADLPASEREEFFTRHCAGDDSLRHELAGLLSQDDEGTQVFLHSPVSLSDEQEGGDDSGSGDRPHRPITMTATRIGPYRILSKIGEGGMGVVYLAEQEQPLRRQVAIKIIKPGVDSPDLLKRFENERQSLARMSHPGIARIFSAGALDTGRPYFVMEAIDGSPITDWCEERSLSLAKRLQLFIDVCDAVQHAHQKGVMHRDIKPANVLVSEVDGAPRSKVIDFGIARAILDGDALGEVEGRTQGEVVGTSLYMSPEQADPDGANVDTRTDVYSLGALLFELLTGSSAIHRDTLAGADLPSLRRILREANPGPPSARVSATGPIARDLARRRKRSPSRLAAALKGDLDAIVLRAMAKKPGDRYAMVAELSADVRRHLRHEPVSASPNTPGYRARKLLRRNPFSLAFAASIVLMVTAWIVIATRDASEARADRQTALEITSFLAQALAPSHGLADRGVASEKRLVLERIVDLLNGGALDDQPGAELLVRRALGDGFHSLGDMTRAELQLLRGLELLPVADGQPSQERWSVLHALARVRLDSDKREGMDLLYESEAAMVNLVSTRFPRVAHKLLDIMGIVEGQDADDLPTHLTALRAVMQEAIPGEHADRLLIANLLGAEALWAMDLGNPALARPLAEEALAIHREILPEVHLDIARSLAQFATVLVSLDEAALAEQTVREALQIEGLLVPDDHWLVARSRSLLGETLMLQQRLDDARPHLLAAHDILLETCGPASSAALFSLQRLVRFGELMNDPELTRRRRDELALAMALHPSGFAVWRSQASAFGPENSELVSAMDEVDALIGGDQDQTAVPMAEIEQAMQRALSLWRTTLPDSSSLSVIIARQWLGWYPPRAPQLLDAREQIYGDALTILRPYEDRLPGSLALAMAKLARVALDRGQADRAHQLAQEGLDLCKASNNVLSFALDECQRVLIGSLIGQGQVDAGLALSVATVEQSLARFGSDSIDASLSLSQLVLYSEATERSEQAAGVLQTVLADSESRRTASLALLRSTWFVLRSKRLYEQVGHLALQSLEHIRQGPPENEELLPVVLAAAALREGRVNDVLELIPGEPDADADYAADLLALRAMALHAVQRDVEAVRLLLPMDLALEKARENGWQRLGWLCAEAHERLSATALE